MSAAGEKYAENKPLPQEMSRKMSDM